MDKFAENIPLIMDARLGIGQKYRSLYDNKHLKLLHNYYRLDKANIKVIIFGIKNPTQTSKEFKRKWIRWILSYI